jgi:uncharacterized protein
MAKRGCRRLIGLLIAGAVAATPVVSTAIESKGPEGPLSGTLVEAGAEAPVLLILPGSGPTDRDGNNSLGVTSAGYRLLAESLAAKNVSSLRADKRGMFGSKAAGDPNKITIAEYATDTNAWLDALQQRYPKTRCFWLLGHSEGGLVALVTARDNVRVCGVVLAAAPGRRLGEVMREQLRANPANAPILDDAMRAIAELEAGRTIDVSSMHPALQGLFSPDVQDFLIDLFAIAPAELAASVKQPLLIIQGGRDQQVTKADFDMLVSARPDATLLLIDDMTHMMKAAADDSQAANVATYTDPSLPVAPEMVDKIAAFVSATDD